MVPRRVRRADGGTAVGVGGDAAAEHQRGRQPEDDGTGRSVLRERAGASGGRRQRDHVYWSGVTTTPAGKDILERMVLAVERVRERLLRATAALEAAGIPYAVAGGNAVAAWVASIDPAAVRNTQDVDILLRRADLDAAARALESAGFIRRHVSG